MNLAAQKKRLQKLWEKNSIEFGKGNWQEDPDFLYFVDILIDLDLHSEMTELIQNLKNMESSQKGFWVQPQHLHVTLALPGRLGSHFQGNDVKFMKKKLETICQNFPVFEIQLGDLNCFSNVLFREIYDPEGRLFELHQQICEAIPFAQHPEYQRENYIPHCSLLYANQCCGEILQHADFQRNLEALNMRVDKVYFGKARDVKGRFERKVLGEFELGKQVQLTKP